jgi:hypothetical protein
MSTTFTYVSGATLTREGRTLILRESGGRELGRHTYRTEQDAVITWCSEAMK